MSGPRNTRAWVAGLVTAMLAAAALMAGAVAGLGQGRAAAVGRVYGDIPEAGSMGLVVWSGGGVEELRGALTGTTCNPASVWANRAGGGLIGYLFDAPSRVNARFDDEYRDGNLPERSPLVLRCAPLHAEAAPAAVVPAAASAPPAPEAITIVSGVPAGLLPDTSAEARLFTLVNRERVSRGLPTFTLDAGLTRVARLHSYDMSQRGFFAHTNPDGLSPFDRMAAAGLVYGWAAENLAMGPSTEWAHQALMDSPSHRQNLLNPKLVRIGIGVVQGQQGLLFTQSFSD